MRLGILLALVLGAGLVASAQSTNAPVRVQRLSLRECIDLALTRNLDLQIERVSVDIAQYGLQGAYGVYSPTFSLRAVNSYVDQPSDFDVDKPNPHFPYQWKADTLGAGLQGRLPTGLSYDLRGYTREDNVRSDFSSAENGFIRNTNNYYSQARLTLTQPLLRDFWIDADRQAILLRRKDVKISQQAMRFQVMKTVLAVELSYTDLLAAREVVRVQEKALELRQRLLAETKRRVEVGDLPPLDAEQAQAQLENTITALTSAREALRLQENKLKALVTDDFIAWVDLPVEPTDPLLTFPPDVNRSESFRNAMQNRPDLLEARLAVEKSDVVVRFRKNQLFPNLDVVGGYGGTGVADTVGRSLNNAWDFTDYSIGAVLTFPLYNLTDRSAYRASKSFREMSQLQLRKAEQEVLLEIADFASRAQSRYAQVSSTRQARVYAEAALGAEEKKLANGYSTPFTVLQYQEILTNARMAEYQAMADYNKLLAQLAFADATILERNHLGFTN